MDRMAMEGYAFLLSCIQHASSDPFERVALIIGLVVYTALVAWAIIDTRRRKTVFVEREERFSNARFVVAFTALLALAIWPNWYFVAHRVALTELEFVGANLALLVGSFLASRRLAWVAYPCATTSCKEGENSPECRYCRRIAVFTRLGASRLRRVRIPVSAD